MMQKDIYKNMHHERTSVAFLHTSQSMKVAHGLAHDTSNLPYVNIATNATSTRQ
jgi:hypothetical protein